jgi:hypothetical protein
MPIQGHPDLSDHDLPRAHRLLMLEFGSLTEFDDPKLEYRRLFSELLGTFMLVLVAAGGGILHGQGQISLAAARSHSTTSRRRVHLGEHELDGSISPPVAQGFVTAMNGESARGRQYRLVLRGEFSARFAREFEGTWSTACRSIQRPPVSRGLSPRSN